MKNKLILCLAVLLAALPLTGSALTISTSYSNATSDNDNHSQEDASSSQTVIGLASATVDAVGNSSGNMGYRFTGQASAYDAGDLTQTVNVTATWTVTAEDWEEYSITLSPELHAYLNIWDWSTDETDDKAQFSSLSSVLRVNGSQVTDTLDSLTGYTRTSDGAYNLNGTASQTLSGYTGNNTFSLQLTGNIIVDAHEDGGLFDNPTANAVLWGQDGTLGFPSDTAHDNFDNYSSSSARDADGLFVDGVVTLNQVPEPASVLMLALGGGLIALKRRFFSK